eukprot:TRINITY_DN4786_c0_g1_i3.p2 TRINITY_DN4786_c0_g1~~TRINITY_DN4786_c0_g1_i3.p2  ORF type:complete len:116 (-),score=31.13 TRINITY_DN4786_c0_g1_i3:269-616(-)
MTTCPLSPVQEELCAQLQIQLHVRTLVLGLARKVQELAELKKKTKTRVLAAAIVYLGCQLEAALDETFIDLATLLAVTRLDLDNLCPVYAELVKVYEQLLPPGYTPSSAPTPILL